MLADERTDLTHHDPISRRCTICGLLKPVPPGTAAYARAHRGEEFPFACPECEERTRDEVEVAGGIADDPLGTQ